MKKSFDKDELVKASCILGIFIIFTSARMLASSEGIF